MKTLLINASDDNPMIILDREKDEFLISGKSLPEDASTFYAPVLEWLTDYKTNPLDETVMVFKFTYFNTASSKAILDILLELESLLESGKNVKIHWYYPDYDEDMKEAGLEFSEMVDIPFVHFSHNP